MSRSIAIALSAAAVFAAATLAACGSETVTTSATTVVGTAADTTGPVGPSDAVDPDEVLPPVAQGATRLWIQSELVECEGVGPQLCMLVATQSDGPFELFYDGIDGFANEVGTSYVIDVAIEQVDDPPADGSSLAYTLVTVVEATEAG